MNLLIFGGTGLIGQAVAEVAEAAGDTVWIPSRRKANTRFGTVLPYELPSLKRLFAQMTPPYAVVNLAGESIQGGRWTEARKAAIHDSRTRLTEAIVSAILQASVQPGVLVNGSAVGYYGNSDEATFTEADGPGHGFLAGVVRDWEGATLRAESAVRVVLLRTGVVLSMSGGALPRMVTPYRMFAGGRVGTGRQWLSWIHIQDAARMVLEAVHSTKISGPINMTAPKPARMDDFGRTIGKVLHRPHWFPVPSFGIRALFGEMSEIVLEGQRVLPKAMEAAGFQFSYPTLRPALEDLLLPGKRETGHGDTRRDR